MPRLLSIALDLVCVLAFAAIGRSAHAEALDPGGLAQTAAPFLAGALMAWVALVLRPLADTLLRQGLIVWVTTLVLGMVFRLLIGQGVQVSFVLVAGAFLALMFFGWRLIVLGIQRARR